MRSTRIYKPVAVIVVAVIFIGLLGIGGSLRRVKFGTVEAVTRFGGLTGRILYPGLSWITPFIEGTETVKTVVQSYEASDQPELSHADFRDYPVTAQTIDGQQITIKYTVLFRISAENVIGVLSGIGQMEEVVANVVTAHSRNLTRLYAQGYTAEGLYSGEGIFAYEDQVREALRIELEEAGATLDDFLVRKIDFDEDYITAIEQQQIAQEQIETERYKAEAAEHEADRQAELARGDADATIERARGEAEAMLTLAEAEGQSIQLRGAALQEFPEVLQLNFIEQMEGVTWGFLPSDSITPFLPIGPGGVIEPSPVVPPAPVIEPTETITPTTP